MKQEKKPRRIPRTERHIERRRRVIERLEHTLENFAEHGKRQAWTLEEAEAQRSRIETELQTLKTRV